MTLIYAEKQAVDKTAWWSPLFCILGSKPFPKSFVDLGIRWHNLLFGEVLISKLCPCLNDGWHEKHILLFQRHFIPSHRGPTLRHFVVEQIQMTLHILASEQVSALSTWPTDKDPTLASANNVTSDPCSFSEVPTWYYKLANAIPYLCPYGCHLTSQTLVTTSLLQDCRLPP